MLLVNSVTSGDGSSSGFVGGWTGEAIDSFVENFKNGLVEISNWIVKGFFDITSPFMDYGIKILIIVCFIVYYCSEDKRAISNGIKGLFIYMVYLLLRSVAI